MMHAQQTTAADWEGPSPQFLDLDEGNKLVFMLRERRASGTIAQLIAARSGEGTSSLARDLALVAARLPGTRTLLLDLDPTGNAQVAAMRSRFGARAVATRALVVPSAEVRVHEMVTGRLPGKLYVSEVLRSPAKGMLAWVAIMPALRRFFGLVLIDSPSIDRCYDAIALAPGVDTNVLVVEAEKTTSAAARNLRDRVQEAGGSIRGVVLNKRN